jgi:hypothetical protein
MRLERDHRSFWDARPAVLRGRDEGGEGVEGLLGKSRRVVES